MFYDQSSISRDGKKRFLKQILKKILSTLIIVD